MNTVLWTVRFFDVAKFTTVTPLSLLISCKLSSLIVGLKISSLLLLQYLITKCSYGILGTNQIDALVPHKSYSFCHHF